MLKILQTANECPIDQNGLHCMLTLKIYKNKFQDLCQITENIDDVETANAIIVHSRDFVNVSLPKWRSPTQVYVLFSQESPVNEKFPSEKG